MAEETTEQWGTPKPQKTYTFGQGRGLAKSPARSSNNLFDNLTFKDHKFAAPNQKSFKGVSRESYGTLSDETTKGVPDPTLYNDLINLILNHKKDIKFSPSAETRVGAERYAKARGLRLGPSGDDINQDGIEDVVLYDKRGYPVMINGYHLKPSQLPYRKAYKENYPTTADRLEVGGYSGWKNQLFGVQGDGEFDVEGKREVAYSSGNLPKAVEEMKILGWKPLAAPRSQLSFYQWAVRIIKEKYDLVRKEKMPAQNWLNSVIPRFSLFSLIYRFIVDIELLNQSGFKKEFLEKADGNAEQAWGLFLKYKKSLSKQVNAHLIANREAIGNKIMTSDDVYNIMEAVGIFEVANNAELTPQNDEAAAQIKFEDPPGFAKMKQDMKNYIKEKITAVGIDMVAQAFNSE